MKILSKTFILFVLIYLLIFEVFLKNNKVSSSGLEIDFIDVGQGDSALIKLNGRAVALVDGGPDYEADRYLNRDLGLFCGIPLIITSHPHADHFLGLERVVKNCKFGMFVFNDVDVSGDATPHFVKLIDKNKTKIVYENDILVFNNLKFIFLWPREKNFIKTSNLNNFSVTVLIKYGDFEVLMLGDLEADGQERLDFKVLNSYIDGELDVLKIAHHGAINGYYPALLHEFRPKTCIISVGKDNFFGHPSPAVVTELSRTGCVIRRTDQEGSVKVLKSLAL